MFFIPSKGMQGNIEEALKRNQHNRDNLVKETNDRQTSDTENREAVEQAITDIQLDIIQNQQDFTDYQISQLGG